MLLLKLNASVEEKYSAKTIFKRQLKEELGPRTALGWGAPGRLAARACPQGDSGHIEGLLTVAACLQLLQGVREITG